TNAKGKTSVMSRGAVGAVIGVLVLAAAAVGGWWFFGGNSEISAPAQEGAEELAAEAASEVVFRIDAESSTAEFRIDEVLRGADFTVVGTTQQIAGDIRVNVEDPSASTIGEIRVNARDLTTDDGNRNRALQRFILRSDQDEFEFITFEPTALQNMPESVNIGRPMDFQIVGNLTIIDTTNEVTFDASVTAVSENQIEGTAEAVVLYQDYELTIPDVPMVASVEDEVTIVLSFVANAVDEDAAAEDTTTETEATEEASS
ncbi:MAG: YceI family protein, partial [Chloroflexota bacterium]